MKQLVAIMLAMGILILGGCGDGSNHDETDKESSTVDPNGIWIGYQTAISEDSDGNVMSDAFDMRTIIYDGEFYGISEDANIVFTGTYEMGPFGRMVSDGKDGGNHSYKMYTLSDGGRHWTDGVTRLTFTENESFEGIYENSALQEGDLVGSYSSLYEKGASLENLTGNYTQANSSFEIKSDGSFSGTKNGCQISGIFSVPDDTVNIYDISYSLSACSQEGSYTGIGILAVDSNDDTQAHFVGLTKNADESRMDGLGFYLEDTPLSFTLARVDHTFKRWLGIGEKDSIVSSSLAYIKNIRVPDVISVAYAVSLPGLVNTFSYEYDLSNQDLSEQIINDSFLAEKLIPFTYGSQGSVWYNYIDFEESDLSHTRLSTCIGYSNFHGADLSYGDMYTDESYSVWNNSFINANLEHNEFFNEGNKTNHDGASLLEWYGHQNDFSGAWWYDGRRCGTDISIISYGSNKCEDRLADTGLTYEEWKSGKTEAEKLAENIGNELGNLADEGEKFIEDPVGTVGSWFGW